MSVSVKSQREIELMREAGRILAIVHEELAKIIEPGITTKHIDQVGYDIIKSYGCEPSFLNYEGYPASICVSVNDEVVHGIPDRKHVLHEGDIVSLDAGVIYKGYHSDAARTHGVGEISKEAQQLIDVTRRSFFEGIKLICLIRQDVIPSFMFAPLVLFITQLPVSFNIDTSSAHVVVLPFVPVTSTIFIFFKRVLSSFGLIFKASFPGRLVPPPKIPVMYETILHKIITT